MTRAISEEVRMQFAGRGGPVLNSFRVLCVASMIALTTGATASLQQASRSARVPPASGFDSAITRNAQRMIEEGRRIFRSDTFGDEAFWGDQLKLHRAIVGAKLGGVGPGLSPKMALDLGLKVDVDAVPPAVAEQLKAGKVDLNDPASTVVLLKANASR